MLEGCDRAIKLASSIAATRPRPIRATYRGFSGIAVIHFLEDG